MTITAVLGGLLGAGIAIGILISTYRPSITLSVNRSILGRLGSMVLAALVVGVATGWPVGAALAALAVIGLPRILSRNAVHKVYLERIEAIASWSEMLRDTLVAAAGLEQAILATAPLAPAAIRIEITELASRLDRGERLASCLRTLAHQLHDPTADLVASALLLSAQYQSRQLADLLGELVSEAREQATTRMRTEAGRTGTRTAVRVIVLTTLSLAAAVALLDRSYLAPYDSPSGQLVLLLIGVVFAASFVWLARIARWYEPERVLTGLPEGART